jgi:hypothetical protein
MRTLQEMLEADRYRMKAPTLRFKDFCQYIYEPLVAVEDTNLDHNQKQALITEISIRLGDSINPSWPSNYKKRLASDRMNKSP